MKHLCPVRAYAEWIVQTRITEGFIFRKMGSGDRHSDDSAKHMVNLRVSLCIQSSDS